MLGRVETVLVDAHDDVERPDRLDRRGHYHALHALVEIWLQHVRLAELARGFDHHVAAGPVGGSQLLVVRQRNASALDHERIALGFNRPVPAAVHRVEVQQVRKGGRLAGRVVDLDELDIRLVPRGAQGETAHAAEAVDANANGEWKRGVSGQGGTNVAESRGA